MVVHVPGHTPADETYVIGDAVLTDDTILDSGPRWTDFRGRDAREICPSIRRLTSRLDDTRISVWYVYSSSLTMRFMIRIQLPADAGGEA
jgi:glyoxylase-like metal-dependent hydrolase (beta-lactamase superfamily II)